MTFFLEQIEYNHWANLALIRAAAELDSDTFDQRIVSGFFSVRETLIHILWAEELWLERWQGRTFIPALNPDDYTELDAIQQKIDKIYGHQLRFIRSINNRTGNEFVSYLNFQGERWEYPLQQMVQHLVIHSAYHRGQLALLFKQLGVQPPPADYLVFIDIQSKGKN
jgi:uncharacterized damage-inducible protein DinB